MNQVLEREINDTKQELLKIKGWIDNNKMDSKVSYLNPVLSETSYNKLNPYTVSGFI